MLLTPATPLRAWHWTTNHATSSFSIGISHTQQTDSVFNWYAYGLLAEYIQTDETEGQPLPEVYNPTVDELTEIPTETITDTIDETLATTTVNKYATPQALALSLIHISEPTRPY